MILKCSRLLWAKVHLKWTEAKGKTVLCSAKTEFQILFGNRRCFILLTKVERDHQARYQCEVQKPASLMVWACIGAYGIVNLHNWKGTINSERYIQLLEEHVLTSICGIFHGRPCIINTRQLQQDFVVEEFKGWTGPPAVQSFRWTFVASWNANVQQLVSCGQIQLLIGFCFSAANKINVSCDLQITAFLLFFCFFFQVVIVNISQDLSL